MTDGVYCDNDIVLKTSCWDLSVEALICFMRIGPVCVLGTARYVVLSQIARSRRIRDKAIAQINFELFIEMVRIIEPTDDEINLAAEFESDAQRYNLSLDGGESILLAALLCRSGALLVTGDKRATVAIEKLKKVNSNAANVGRRLACLEQLFSSLMETNDFQMLQNRVCGEPATDAALSNCFSCRSGKFSQQSISDGLSSYVVSLRSDAPSVLLSSVDLSAVVA
jgi:hypothetical protein